MSIAQLFKWSTIFSKYAKEFGISFNELINKDE